MAGVKLFRKADRNPTPNARGGAVRGLINPLISDAKATFFYAVFPATGSPSARQEIAYPTAGPS